MGNTAFVTTGIAQANAAVFSSGAVQTQTSSFRILLDPVLAPGQFRKATGLVSISSFGALNYPSGFGFGITDTSASLDDESGKVELRFDLTLSVGGPGASANINQVVFQVTALATI